MRRKRDETESSPRKGRENAHIVRGKKANALSFLADSPAFGMWSDHEEMVDPATYVRRSRRGRLGGS